MGIVHCHSWFFHLLRVILTMTNYSGIVSDISSESMFGIYIYSDSVPDILSDSLSGIEFGIDSGIVSGIRSDILSDILSGICSGILSGILSDIISGILSGLLFGILSCIYSDILVWHSFWSVFGSMRVPPTLWACRGTILRWGKAIFRGSFQQTIFDLRR